MMKKIVAAGVLVSLMTAAAAFAQGPGGPGRGPGPGPGPGSERGWNRASPEDRAAFLDGRIAALKATLRLTPDQEKLWPPVEAALREAATLRTQRMEQWREARRNPPAAPQDPVQRMRAAADRMAENAAMLKKLADAAQPLYASLDAAQKRRADAMLGRGRHMMARGFMGGPGFMHGPGPMGPMRGPMMRGGPGGPGDGPRQGTGESGRL